MTRETKVGLIVAGSFLALLGVVIASKMRGDAETPSNDVVAAVTPGGEESETREKKPKDEGKGIEPPKPLPDGMLPVGGTLTPGKDGPPLPPPVDFSKPFELPPVEKEDPLSRLKDKIAEQDRDKKKDGEVGPPPGAPLYPEEREKPAVLPPPVVDLGKKDPTPPPVVDLGKKDITPPPIFPEVEKKDNLPPPVFPPVADKRDGPPPVSFPAKDKKDEFPPPPTFPDTAKKDTFPPPVFPGEGKKEKIDTPPPVAKQDKKDLPPIPPIDPGLDKKGPAVVVTPPIVDKKDGPPPVPPIGIGFEKPPMGVTPPAKDASKVLVVDIIEYTLRPEDRDFAAVAKKAYESERYARALQAYNQKHPMADPDVRAPVPVLKPGAKVYVPPVEFLTKNYSTLIDDARPVIGAAPPDVPPVKIGGLPPMGSPPDVPPIGAGKTPGLPVSIGNPMTPGSVPSRTEATKRFVVPGAGQFILQIAQQTLGDSRRWPEIYRLNPGVQPSNPIPGGTELRLPMDARVP